MIISFEKGQFKRINLKKPVKPIWSGTDGDEPLCPNCKKNIQHIFGYVNEKSVCECGRHIDWKNWENG